MLQTLVFKMIQSGATSEEVLAEAISLSRVAFGKLTELEAAIDQVTGSCRLRKETIEPLLEKDRQIEGLRHRLTSNGPTRSGDPGNLSALLQKRVAEYEQLCADVPWTNFSLTLRKLVESYVQERRNHLSLGDADKVLNAFHAAGIQQRIAC